MSYDDDFAEDDFDEDEASEGDDDTFDTVACPYCRKQIHEDAVRCPYCENYISAADAPRLKVQPWWIIAGVVVCLVIVLIWLSNRLYQPISISWVF